MLELPQRAAAVVQSNPMRELGPRKRIRLLDIVQELDHLEGAGANLLDLQRLFDRIQIGAHVMDATAGGCNDVIEAGKVADEERFRVGALGVEPAVRHRLPATGLVTGIDDLMTEPLQKLECCYAYFGEEGIDVARDEQPDPHLPPACVLVANRISRAPPSFPWSWRSRAPG